MKYKTPNKNDSTEISELSTKEIGWQSSPEHLGEMLEKYPSTVALKDDRICGFIYSQALSSDILRICNFVVEEENRDQGIGTELLETLEDQARESGYRAILFPEDPSWFDQESLQWLESQGYRDIYKTEQSCLAIKETTKEALPV